MNSFSRKVLFWTPRLACLGFAIFLSLFALDVLSEGNGFWKTVLGLLIHLGPVYIVLVLLALAWRWEWVGAVGFGALAIWYAAGNLRHHPDWVLVIAGPLVVLATLFLVNWAKHDQLRARP